MTRIFADILHPPVSPFEGGIKGGCKRPETPSIRNAAFTPQRIESIFPLDRIIKFPIVLKTVSQIESGKIVSRRAGFVKFFLSRVDINEGDITDIKNIIYPPG